METISKTPNYSLPSGDITLVTATIGPMSGGLDFRLDSPLKGVDTPENLAATEEMESRVPRIAAVRLKDGHRYSGMGYRSVLPGRGELLPYEFPDQREFY